ncbi:MAG TPA: lytic transglycosylase domain-containing protein [Candidatus Limnocylindrales bacterium]|nr:lytic transglycosylase domain-containing protein [Candidatus Limnocylindrales bacterium]
MPSGRLKAVLVASVATIILVGVVAPARTRASDPPGLARFMAAVAHVESHGDYTARNPSGAYGKYQIMPASWRGWAARYLGNPAAKPTPANQEIVAAAKMRALYAWLGSWRRVAYWWLTGSSRTSGWSAVATRYVTRVMTAYRDGAGTEVSAAAPPAAPAAAATRVPARTTRRYGETNAGIAYAGSWKSARYSRYAGGAAMYATAAGATATFRFSGREITWYGPTGPTRGTARVRVDGRLVATVDLHASSFTAHKAVFRKTWSTAGSHTLVIEVGGTSGHPYVAIDELVVGS